jgi:hypothetical protein
MRKATEKQEPKEGLSRRSFLKMAAGAAATISMGTVFGCGVKSPSTSEQQELMQKKFKGIKIVGLAEKDLDILETTIQYLHDMPEKLENIYGIKYDEPKKLIEDFAKSGGFLCLTKDLDPNSDNEGAAFYYDKQTKTPYIFINRPQKNAAEFCLPPAAFHELNHYKQNEAGALYPPTSVSSEDSQRILFEAERSANAAEAEFTSLAAYLETSKSFTKEMINSDKTMLLKAATPHTKSIIKNEPNLGNENAPNYLLECLECKRDASVDVLNIIKDDGNNVENLNTKKTAIKRLSGNTESGKQFATAYQPQTTQYAKRHAKDAAPPSPESTKIMEGIVDKLYSLDSRTNGKPLFDRTDPEHPLNAVNNAVFKEIILQDEKQQPKTTSDTASLTSPQPEVLTEEPSATKEVIEKGFARLGDFLNKKSGRC